MKVGFIGIGAMGRHMSRHILQAGFSLMVHDLKKEAAQEVLSKGATWGDSPRIIAEQCEVVLASLPTPSDVESIVYGEHGLLSGWSAGRIFVDMSTNSPEVIRQIAQDIQSKGVEMLDAPVSGGTAGAESGRLTIIVGGKVETLEKVRKVFEAMGKNIVHVGDIGCGNIAKLINNMIALSCSQVTAEGMVLGARAGIDVRTLREVILTSTGENFFLKNGMLEIFNGNFEPGFRINLAIKDIGLALQMAKGYSVPTPIGAATEQELLKTKAWGLGNKGAQAVILPLEKLAGVEVRPH